MRYSVVGFTDTLKRLELDVIFGDSLCVLGYNEDLDALITGIDSQLADTGLVRRCIEEDGRPSDNPNHTVWMDDEQDIVIVWIEQHE